MEIDKVEGWGTIFKFDPEKKTYQDFLQTRELANKRESYELGRTAEKLFSDFLNINYVRKNPQAEFIKIENTCLRKDSKLEVWCAGTEIIPGKKDGLDGYAPILEFNAQNKNISVKTYLKREGSWTLRILEEILEKTNINGDGMKKPKIQFFKNKDTSLLIASIEQIPLVLKNLRQIYDHIGSQRLKEMHEMNYTIGKDIDEESKKILINEYSKKIKLLTPANL